MGSRPLKGGQGIQAVYPVAEGGSRSRPGGELPQKIAAPGRIDKIALFMLCLKHGARRFFGTRKLLKNANFRFSFA